MPLTNPKSGHFGLILPLCTSSATVGLALYQFPVFLSFLRTEPSIAGKPLSRFWATHIQPGAGLISTIALTSSVAGAIAARWLNQHATLETTDVSSWYTYGAVLAAGHLVFWPFVAGPVSKMIAAGKEDLGSAKTEADIEQTNKEEMRNWLVIHAVRTVLVDLPALLCFAEGAALSFWVI